MFPELFRIGNFWVGTYGLLVTTGVLVGLMLAARYSRLQGIDPEDAWNLGILAVFSAIVGAKIMLVINDWSTYSRDLSQLWSMQTLRAGGVFYGGLIAAVVASVAYIRRHRLPVLRTCDAFAPGIAMGHAIGRLGCFSAGCCYGKPTNLPWGVVFHNPLAQEISQTPLGVKLHPTQLYESLVELLNFLILVWLLKRKRQDGQVLGAYLFLYGFARFFIEFIRDDPERGSLFNGAMTYTQLVSVFMVIAGGALWLRRGTAERPVTTGQSTVASGQ